MKKKTKSLIQFIDDLHNHIIGNPQFRKDTAKKSESFISILRNILRKKATKIFHKKLTNHFIGKVKKESLEELGQQLLLVEIIQIL